MSTRQAQPLFNFAPGPAQLPPEVRDQAAEAVQSFPPRGRSILELSHRSDTFAEIAAQAETDLRALLGLSDKYAVVFLNGGARVHYTLWVHNLTMPADTLGFLDTGFWSRQAITQARALRPVRIVGTASRDYPDVAAADTESMAFLHYVSNETLTGVATPTPEAACPLVCDRTSDFLSEPFDVQRYALCYAGSQKNFGTAGLVVLVVRRENLRDDPDLPPGLSYSAQAAAGGLVHTPSVFSWYVAALMLRWIREQGGLPEMARRAAARAETLYTTIDRSPFYRNDIQPRARSRMNVCFHLSRPELLTPFLERAETAGLLGLRGHSAVGGIRASLYNAMPDAGVDALCAFLQDFETQWQ